MREQAKTQTIGVKLTEASNYLVDFTRIGERIFSSVNWMPNYSRQEIMSRLFIVMSTVAAGWIGYRCASPESQSHYFNRAVKTSMTAFAGFFVSHLIAIFPLIKKRYEIQQECMVRAQTIRDKFKNNAELLPLLEKTIQKILALTFVENGDARASLTWGRRNRFMQVLYERIHSVNLTHASQLALTKLYFNALIDAKDFTHELTTRAIEPHADNNVTQTARV